MIALGNDKKHEEWYNSPEQVRQRRVLEKFGAFGVNMAVPFSEKFGSGNFDVFTVVRHHLYDVVNFRRGTMFNIEYLEAAIWKLCSTKEVRSPKSYWTRERIMEVVKWTAEQMEIDIEWTPA